MVNRNLLIPLVLLAIVAACAEEPAPTEALAPAFAYGSPGCYPPEMTPTQVCELFHPAPVTATAYCLYDDCFEMADGEFVKVVAADERGEYPMTWFTWSDATLRAPPADPACLLRQEGKTKTRVEIPSGYTRCKLEGSAGQNTYYEHFASVPIRQCLGWLECRVP